jgi:hypothetical protein
MLAMAAKQLVCRYLGGSDGEKEEREGRKGR